MVDHDLARRIVAAIDEERTLAFVQQLLRIPSFSGQEAGLAQNLADTMHSLGMRVELQEVEPGRPNAIGLVKGSGAGLSMLFNGHMDHIAVGDGWTRDPFGGEYEDGCVYGVGAANMKAAGAAYLAAVDGLQRAGVRLAGDVVLEYVVGQLRGGDGTKHAVKAGVRADYFVDGEPTELALITLHAGVVILKVEVFGRTRHYVTGSGETSHAIEALMRLVGELGPSYTAIAPGGWLSFQADPDLAGLPQMNVGAVRGGVGRDCSEGRPALVPDYCYALLDVRIVPGQVPESVRDDVQRVCARLGMKAKVSIQPGFSPPFRVSRDAPVVQALGRAHQQLTGRAAEYGGPSSFAVSDAPFLAEAGMTGLLYGPGGKYLSQPDERVALADVVTAARVYALVAADVCGLTPS